MYKEKYPQLPVSKERYREVFTTKFNLSFGYPRTDTCSSCDKFEAEIKVLNLELSGNVSEEKKNELNDKIKQITTENQVHMLKATTFYTRKRMSRLASKKDVEKEAICMDYQKNLPLPNISTNDVYYKRQLSFYSFNIHQLSDREAIFYTYTENIANKGANEVISFLYHYLSQLLKKEVKSLEIYCDSCSGQNKNYAVFLFTHYLVHNLRLLDSVTLVFPIRGHSYMECDKNCGLLNKKTVAELPKDWNNALEAARANPKPFQVIPVEQEIVRDWVTFFKQNYKPKCPFRTRPIREAKVEKEDALFYYRTSYNGPWISADLKGKESRKHMDEPHIHPGEFLWPHPAYTGTLPISFEKFKDLQDLINFCGPEAREFYQNLSHCQDRKKK